MTGTRGVAPVGRQRRPYRSPLREARAAETRALVLDAAARLFVERGFGLVTMKEIAERAGVAVETVYAQGSKTSLLLVGVERAVAGDGAPAPLADRPAFDAAVRGRSRATVVAESVAFLLAVVERAGGLLVALENASSADAELAEAWRQAEERRWADHRRVAEALHRTGGLAPGFDVDRAADALWATLTPRLGHTLLADRGWSGEQLHDWAARTVRAVVSGGDGT